MSTSRESFASADKISPIAKPRDEDEVEMELSDFSERDWIPIREDRFPTAGIFLTERGGITNFIPPNATDEELYHAKDGIGFALRLLKASEMRDGYIETELELQGTAAPSIYFRTQILNDTHRETYNLIVFNHTQVKPDYQGVNLYKWQREWAHNDKTGWKRMATWIFPVPLNQKLKLAVEFKKGEITVFFNDRIKGHFFDADPLPAGRVGLCSIEGKNYFHTFNVRKS